MFIMFMFFFEMCLMKKSVYVALPAKYIAGGTMCVYCVTAVFMILY